MRRIGGWKLWSIETDLSNLVWKKGRRIHYCGKKNPLLLVSVAISIAISTGSVGANEESRSSLVPARAVGAGGHLRWCAGKVGSRRPLPLAPLVTSRVHMVLMRGSFIDSLVITKVCCLLKDLNTH